MSTLHTAPTTPADHSPLLSLRKRSSQHPMAMFAIMATVAFGTMAFLPMSGAAFASLGVTPYERAPIVDNSSFAQDATTTQMAPRVAALSEADIACAGQAWGAETAECLSAIAKVSGRNEVQSIRTIAGSQQASLTPNIF